jgi:hypothetical protein
MVIAWADTFCIFSLCVMIQTAILFRFRLKFLEFLNECFIFNWRFILKLVIRVFLDI